MEALFYLDVAKRAIDEIVSVCVCAGLGTGATLPRRAPEEYLLQATLDTILVDDLQGPLEMAVYRQHGAEGGTDEVEAALADYETSMLAELKLEMALERGDGG